MLQAVKLLVEGQGEDDRVWLDLDGRRIWFSSPDVELVPAPEALASLLLFPALRFRRSLRLDAPLDRTWLQNAARLREIYHRWWRTPLDMPLQGAGEIDAPAPASDAACFFSGGVDSFHAVLRPSLPLQALVFVHGFDIDIDDRARADAFEPVFRRVAAERGLRAVLVRTNLRRHPFLRALSWRYVHGAAMAAVAHLLGGAFGKLCIASSIRQEEDEIWGSHWLTDPLWSSHRVRIVHHAADIHRNQKLLQIAREPILRDALRVCWEHRGAALNCSVCEKCLRTMVLLSAAGERERYTVFDHGIPLVQRLDALPGAVGHLAGTWANIRAMALPPDLAAAVERLGRRSRYAALHPALLGRHLRHPLTAGTRAAALLRWTLHRWLRV